MMLDVSERFESIIKKLEGLKRLERIGEGRSTRYRVIS